MDLNRLNNYFFSNWSSKLRIFFWMLIIILVPTLLVSDSVLELSRELNSNENLTLLEYSYDKKHFLPFTNERILSGKTITGQFVAESNMLGIIAVRFDTHEKINEDSIIFRLSDSEKIIAENIYTVGQFQPDQLFPFGFPNQEFSESKDYYFEIESVNGTATNSVSLSSIEPIFVTRHKYTKEMLLGDFRPVLYFLQKKLVQIRFALIQIPPYMFSSIQNVVIYLSLILIVRRIGIANIMSWCVLNFSKVKMLPHILKNMWVSVNHHPFSVNTFFLLNNNRQFMALDGLRAWAILSVISAHTSIVLDRIVQQQTDPDRSSLLIIQLFNNIPFLGAYGGSMGVNLFFIISGFLIFMSLSRKKELSLWSFIKRRYERLLPAHIITIIPLLAGSSFLAIILNAFFFVELFAHVVNVNILTWTMTYEMIFYFFCALWVIQSRKHSWLLEWKYFLSLAVFLIATEFYVSQQFTLLKLKYLDIDYFLAFFFGIALGRIYFDYSELWKKMEYFLFPLSIIGLIFISIYRATWYQIIFLRIYGEFGVHISMLFLNLGLFVVVASAISSQGNYIKSFFQFKYLRVIGVVSYSMYLVHMAYAIPIATRLIKNLPEVIQLCCIFGMNVLVSFIIGCILFHYLEKPYFLNTSSKVNQSDRKK